MLSADARARPLMQGAQTFPLKYWLTPQITHRLPCLKLPVLHLHKLLSTIELMGQMKHLPDIFSAFVGHLHSLFMATKPTGHFLHVTSDSTLMVLAKHVQMPASNAAPIGHLH